MKALNSVSVKVKTLPHFKGPLPEYKSEGASGLDVTAVLEQGTLTIKPLERKLLPTGLCFEIPAGWEFQVRPRSGLALKKGFTLLNPPGTIDSDYRGELKLIVINLSQSDVTIKDGERLAQLVLCPIGQVRWDHLNTLGASHRGDLGFGLHGSVNFGLCT